MSRARRFATPYCITDGKHFRLRDVDPGDTNGFTSRTRANAWLERDITRLSELQEKLYAQDRWGLLADLSGDGRGREGRHDQARDVGRQPAGLPGLLVQAAVAAKNSITISCGGPQAAFRSAAASASSIARTTKRCWWCGCIPSSSPASSCRRRS